MALPLRYLQKVGQSLKGWNFKPKNSLFLYPSSNILLKSISRSCTTEECYDDKDPAPLFFNKKVQEILKRLTGLNIEKVFKDRYLESPDQVEEYKFLTKEDFEEQIDMSLNAAKRLLQMPPVVKERVPICEILSFDPAIQGKETDRMIFTDVSFGVSDRKRIIVVREADGTLRQATWEERDRMNQIYNPRPGRQYKLPQIFEDQFLKDALNREEYVFVLDFACAHFEADDPLYHKVTRTAFEHIKKNTKYDVLFSTRHYGPMCFYLAWNKNIDNLLISYIQEERLEEGVDLIQLYHLIHDRTKASVVEQTPLECIKKYIAEESVVKPNLQLAIQVYQETMREREALQKVIETSHGISS